VLNTWTCMIRIRNCL